MTVFIELAFILHRSEMSATIIFVSVNNDAVETEPRLTPLQRHGCAYAGLAGLGFQRLGSTSLTS